MANPFVSKDFIALVDTPRKVMVTITMLMTIVMLRPLIKKRSVCLHVYTERISKTAPSYTILYL